MLIKCRNGTVLRSYSLYAKRRATILSEKLSPSVTQQLAEDFGANASYVETLLDRYLSAPDLVDESWASYFAGLVGEPKTNGKSLTTTNGHVAPASSPEPAPTSKMPAKTPALQKPVTPVPENAEVLRGGAKKIVENMEQSLTVPTATSVRMVPVKL